MAQVTGQLCFRWWWKWYVRGVILTAHLTGLRPNTERVEYWARRALYWREVKPECRSS